MIAAVARYLAEPGPRLAQEVEASHSLLRSYLGVDWDALFAVPWIAELWHSVWFTRACNIDADRAGSLGARAGEVGTALVAALREAALAHIIERCARVAISDPEHAEQRTSQIRAEPAFQTAADMRAYLDQGFVAAFGDRAPAAAAETRLQLWGQGVQLEGLLESFARSARPDITLAGDRPTLS